MQSMTDRKAVLAVVNSGIDTYLKEGGDCQFVVKGGCMSPLLKNADHVTVRQKSHYYPGDVVAYYCPFKEMRVVHRLLGQLTLGTRRVCLIKADNQTQPDVLVARDSLLGYVTQLPTSHLLRVKCSLLFAYWIIKLTSKKIINGLH